jgi:ubiquinone/menaquinone biosynthesis C-methylase UbiE
LKAEFSADKKIFIGLNQFLNYCNFLMKAALSYDLIKKVYNKTAGYYDRYHKLGTYGFDERGRKFLVNKIVKPGDYILDAGGGTGSTAIRSIIKMGKSGKAVVLDYSDNMLMKAKGKAENLGIAGQLEICAGDMYEIPFPDNTFDAVLSTYSTCPLADPIQAVREMIRVARKGGLIGIAHSTDANNRIVKRISSWIEFFIWKFPRLSLGCRNIQLIDGIKKLDVEIVEDRIIGFIPFYFRLIIFKKL